MLIAALLGGGCVSTDTSSRGGPRNELEEQFQFELDIVVQKVPGGMVCSAVVPGGSMVRQGDVQLKVFDQNGEPIRLDPVEAPDSPVPVSDHTAHALYRLNLKPNQHPTSGLIRWDGHQRRVQPLGWVDHGNVIRGEPSAGGKAE